MLLQASLLQQITTKNLLQITISETQLQSNFELILKALRSHDSSLANLANRMNSVEGSVKSSEEKRLSDQQKQLLLKQQLKRIQNELGDMKDRMNSFQQFKKDINQKMQNYINPESNNQKDESHAQIKEWMKLLQQKMEKVQEKVNAHDAYDKRITDLQKQLKEQNSKISKLDDSLKEIQKENLKNKNATENKLTHEEIKKMLAQLQASLQAKTNEKINVHKKETKNEIQKLSDKINDLVNQMKKVNQSLNDQSKLLKKCSQDIWKLSEQIYKLQLQQKSNNSNHFDSKKVAELQRRIQVLQQSMNFSKLSNNYPTTNKTENDSPTKRDQEEMNLSQIKEEPKQDKNNFKQEIIDKLKQQKGDFTKALKKLDTITLKKDQDKHKMGNLQDKILRIQHILDTKVDDEGMKKWMRYIQNKIAYLYRIVNVDVPEEDACIARKNWICLSCDKNLDSYKGKVGNHLISAQLKGKTIQNEVVGGGMLFRSKSRYQIPSLKK